MMFFFLLTLLAYVSLSFDTPLTPLRIIEGPSPALGHRDRTLFTFPVSIGSSNQTIPLIVDTATTVVTVNHPSCQLCQGSVWFDPQLSNSDTYIARNDNRSELITDDIRIGENGNYLVKNYLIEVTLNVSGNRNYGNGFFGLSPETELVWQMYCSAYIDKWAFAVFLTGNGMHSESMSELQPVISWGDWDIPKYSTSPNPDFDYVRVVSDSEWTVLVTSVMFGDVELAGSSYAVLDSRDGRFAIPAQVEEAVFLPALQNIFGIVGRNHPCEKFKDLPDIVVTFGTVKIAIPKEVYLYKGTENCSLEVVSNEGESTFVFGVPFFQSAYVLFDLYNRRVGIAPSRNVNKDYQWALIAAVVVAVIVIGAVVVVCRIKKKPSVDISDSDKTEPLNIDSRFLG